MDRAGDFHAAHEVAADAELVNGSRADHAHLAQRAGHIHRRERFRVGVEGMVKIAVDVDRRSLIEAADEEQVGQVAREVDSNQVPAESTGKDEPAGDGRESGKTPLPGRPGRSNCQFRRGTPSG